MKTKQIFLTITFLISFLSTLAQERYNYIYIQFMPFLKNEMQISIDGKEYKEEKADYSPNEKTTWNVNPLLKKIKEYEEKDWELVSLQSLATGTGGVLHYHAYLRKKIAPTK